MKKIITSLLMLSSISMMMTSCEGTEETPIDPEDPFMVVQVDGEPISSISLSSQKDATSSFVVSTNQQSSTIDISLDSSLEAWLEASVSEKTVVITTLSKNESTTSNRKGTLTVSAGEDGLLAAEITITQGASQATGEDPDPNPDQGAEDYGEDPNLPEREGISAYSYAISAQKYYYPVSTKYKSGPTGSYISTKVRIVPYLYGFTPDYTNASYVNSTNKFGSSTTLPRQTSTGRFYTKKIGDRWWVVDPEGYLHHHRGFCSVTLSNDEGMQAAFNSKFGGNHVNWLTQTRDEMHDLGFHGTGAFGSDVYDYYLEFNAGTDKPLTLCPSMGFLSAFHNSDKTNNAYPDDNGDNKVGFVLYDGWAEFCVEYVKEQLGKYKGDPNLFGFFSDNELNFSSMHVKLLDRFLDLEDHTNIAYTTAAKFMEDNGKSANDSATDALNSVFSGMMAELYYKAIREAVDAFDPGIQYVGSRLHGTPKQTQGVIEAAAKYCDIISVNYYNNWNMNHMDEWEEWAEGVTDGVGCPILITEFYTKGNEGSRAPDGGELANEDGAGYTVPTQKERGYTYQHLTLGMLEAKNCIGWHWFRYIDGGTTNNGVFDYKFDQYEEVSSYMRRLNYNAYNLIEYFDN